MRGPLSIVVALALFAGCAAQRPTAPAASGAPAPAPGAAPAAAADKPEPTHDVAYVPHEDHDEDPEDGEDQPDVEAPEVAAAPKQPHPLDGKTRAEIARAFAQDPASIGSVSLGRPSAGALLNGVQMPRGAGWQLIDPGHAYGTQETVDYIARAIGVVRARFPDAHDVYIGHISARQGGALRPHMSHQAGRDVDLSYFYSDDSARWYRRATEANLDRERTWAFVRALITETDVELILIDRGLQKLLREHAVSAGEDPAWVSSLFDGVRGVHRPLIFHANGHATHLHVRFYNPIAQQTAVLAHDVLVARGLASAATSFVAHRAKNGETLGMLARKYGTTVREIQRANGLRSVKIRAKQVYRIPKRGALGRPAAVSIPPRRLPPNGSGKSAQR